MAAAPTEPSRFGIRARLLALLIPCMLGLLALDSWNDYRALKTLVQDAYDRVLLDSAHALRSGVSLAPDGGLRLDAASTLAQTILGTADRPDKYLRVSLRPAASLSAKPPEKVLFGEADLPAPPAVERAALPATPAWYEADYRGQRLRLVALRSSVVDGQGQAFDLLVQAAEGTALRDQAEADSLRQQLFRDARTVLVMVALVWLGVTWSLRPLERLRASVLARAAQAPEPLDLGGVPHEVAPLVSAVNHQVASHRQLLDAQSQFLSDASHQLRTPLAIMMTQLGVALREKDPAQLKTALRAMRDQIARSRRLCEQLLSLAHARESTPADDAATVTDLNHVAKEVVLQYLALAHEKDQDLGWVDARTAPGSAGDDAMPAVPVQASSAELHEVLSNLLHNAIVHTPVGGHITVQARTADGMALAEVCDDGPGIAVARRAEVFERFRQIEGADGHAGTRGAGLGLAIARAYAQRNGGDIELADPAPSSSSSPSLSSTRETGLRAILRLPLLR